LIRENRSREILFPSLHRRLTESLHVAYLAAIAMYMAMEMPLYHHHPNLRIFQHEPETVIGEGRIQGNIAPSRLENTQETHKTVHRALDTETHRQIGADS
jgi:hypothetical protein